MRISIALATRNGEAFLRDQLESLVEQTLPPYEVVVSDDASTDATVRILEDFRARAPFEVTVAQNASPLGYADNFLRAATLCRGDFVAFCDQDDVWMPEKLARCAGHLAGTNATLLVHRNVVVRQNLVPTRHHLPRFRRSFTAEPLGVLPWLIPPGNAMVVSREIFEIDASGRPRAFDGDRPMTHDEWTYFLGTALGVTHFTSDILVKYRQHGRNVYGAPGRTPLGRLLAPGIYGVLAARARERGEFFAELPRRSPRYTDSAERAAQHYRELAGRLEARSRIYEEDATPAARFRRFAHLAGAGGYRARTRGGFGVRSLFKDLVATVAVRRLPQVAGAFARASARRRRRRAGGRGSGHPDHERTIPAPKD